MIDAFVGGFLLTSHILGFLVGAVILVFIGIVLLNWFIQPKGRRR